VEELEVEVPEPQEDCKEQDQNKDAFEREHVPDFFGENGGLLHKTPYLIWYVSSCKKKVGDAVLGNCPDVTRFKIYRPPMLSCRYFPDTPANELMSAS